MANKPLFLRLSDEIYKAIDELKLPYEEPNEYAKRAILEKIDRDRKSREDN